MLAHHSKQTNSVTGNGVYERVKARIIAHEYSPGKRILVEPLADQFFVSSTPVREALIRLAAERVINEVPKAGFFAKEISASETGGLYALQQLLLDWSLSAIDKKSGAPGILKPPLIFDETGHEKEISSETAVQIANELFLHIARQSGNADIIRLIENINDRTHYFRRQYFEAFEDARCQLLQLCQTYYRKEFDQLRNDLSTHFHEKMDRLPDLLRILRGSLLKTSV